MDDDNGYDYVDEDDDGYEEDFDDNAADVKAKADAEAEADADALCKDSEERCSFWASAGECTNNPNYMLNNCKRSCNNCANRNIFKSGKAARKREEEELLNIIQQYGEAQQVDGGKDKDTTMLQIRKTIDYMKNYVFAEKPTHRLSPDIIKECTNNHELCAFWAAIGKFRVFRTSFCFIISDKITMVSITVSIIFVLLNV